MLREEGQRESAEHGWEGAEGAVAAVAVVDTAAEVGADTAAIALLRRSARGRCLSGCRPRQRPQRQDHAHTGRRRRRWRRRR